MEGKFAILNNDMIVLDVYEGNLEELDISKYDRYGGEVKINDLRGIAVIGQTYNPITDLFESNQ